MSKFLTGKELEKVVYDIIWEAQENLIIVSPFIKLDDYFKKLFENHLNNPRLNIIIVFGKNEGNKQKRRVLIKDGILNSYMIDKLNALRMNDEPTNSGRRESYKYAPTSRMTNTYIDNGESTFDEIIAATEYGLYECGVSVRDLTNPKVKELGELWHQQNLTWSYQDQVSFPYCLWKTGLEPDVLPRSFRDMSWIYLASHKNPD